MTLIDFLHKDIPEYYNGMHRDGYEPFEILTAIRKMQHRRFEEFSSGQDQTIQNINIKSEIKIK